LARFLGFLKSEVESLKAALAEWTVRESESQRSVEVQAAVGLGDHPLKVAGSPTG